MKTDPGPREPPKHTFYAILPILSVMTLTRLSFGALAIVFPLYVNASGVATGFALALYPLLEGFSASPLGSYSDRIGRKKLFTAGLVSLSLLNILMGTSRNYTAVSLVHAFMGVSAAAVTVTTLALITDYTRSSNRGRWMGAFDMANLLGYSLGFLFGSYFSTHFSSDLSYTFFTIAGILAGTSLLSFLVVRDVQVDHARAMILNPFTGMSRSTSSLTPLWFALTTIIGVAFFLPKALNTVGTSQLGTGLLLTGVVAVLGIGSVIWGVVSDHVGRGKTLLVGVVSMNAFLIYLLWAGTDPATLFSARHLVAIVPLILLLSAVVPSLLAAVGDDAKAQRRGSVMGLYSLLLSFGLAFGNVLAGLGFDWMNLEGLVTLALAQLLANEVLAVVLRYRSGKEPEFTSTTSP